MYLYRSLTTFSLSEITNLYKKLNENLDLEYFFFDSDKNPVKVLKIEKIPYSGRIYDVDVLNDIKAWNSGDSIWGQGAVNDVKLRQNRVLGESLTPKVLSL